VNWTIFRGLMLRAAHNRGFAAPNLPTLHAPRQFTVDNLPGRVDPYFAHTIGSGQYVMRSYSSGNAQLKALTSTGESAGIVLEVPKVKGLSVSVDYWKIEQQDVVGARTDAQILDSDNALLRAYTTAQLAAGRAITEIDLGSGTANYKGDPAIVRNAPTPQEIAAFASFNASRPPAQQAAAVGTILSRSAPYENIARGTASGIDFSVAYQLPAARWGRVSIKTDWCYFIESKQTRMPAGAMPATAERLGVDGTTRWRGMGTISWRKSAWQVTVGGYYIGHYADSGATTTAEVFEALGQPRHLSRQFSDGTFVYRYRVPSVSSYNLSAAYRLGRTATPWRDFSIRLGIVNVMDQAPPLTSDAAGYAPAIHSNLFPGRTWTLELTREF
jgi:hypothetical protein